MISQQLFQKLFSVQNSGTKNQALSQAMLQKFNTIVLKKTSPDFGQRISGLVARSILSF